MEFVFLPEGAYKKLHIRSVVSFLPQGFFDFFAPAGNLDRDGFKQAVTAGQHHAAER